jgi:hypothetical protein
MKRHGPVALRSPTGGLILPLQDDYDCEVLFESIADRVRRHRSVDVSTRCAQWRAVLIAPHAKIPCTSCAEALTIAHVSGESQLCTRCQKRALR